MYIKYSITIFIYADQLFPNNGVERYRSPLSHTITTITPYYNVSANLMAAVIVDPLLWPAKMHYSFAILLAIFNASSALTSTKSSRRFLSNILGRSSGAHLIMPAILFPSDGCTPIILISGFFYFRYLLTPIHVPVVPHDATK